jgi:hypothetical protein
MFIASEIIVVSAVEIFAVSVLGVIPMRVLRNISWGATESLLTTTSDLM